MSPSPAGGRPRGAVRGAGAVMAGRKEPVDSLDYFPTPPWATRALVECVIRPLFPQPERFSVWEPACGEGHMARPLGETFRDVYASDIFPYGYGDVADFLPGGMLAAAARRADWIITNPPFKAGLEFAKRALELADVGVALLVRTQFIEGGDRYRQLFQVAPPAVLAPFVERAPMVRGRVDGDATSATSYSWLLWVKNDTDRPARGECVVRWIPPCRARLERPGDYAPQDLRGSLL